MKKIEEMSRDELIEEIRNLNAIIDELKEQGEKTKESERMLEYSQSIAHLGSWKWDVNNNEFFGSKETYNIFEIPPGTPVDYSVLMDLVHPDDRPMLMNAMEEGLKGARYDLEFRIISGKGRLKYVQGIALLEYLESGDRFLSGTVQDITEKKEQALEQKRLITELQDALGKIKALSGLLHICANCKRIQNDQGDWVNMEKYIEEHSEAGFTHSFCPECEEELYGKEMRKE